MSWGWSNSWALSAQCNIAQLCTTATEEAVEQSVNIVATSNVTSRGYVLMSTVTENWAGEQRRHKRSTHYPVWAFVVIWFQPSGMSWQNFGYIKFRKNPFRSSRYVYKDTHTHTHIHTYAHRHGEAKKLISATFHCHSANKRHLAHVRDWQLLRYCAESNQLLTPSYWQLLGYCAESNQLLTPRY